MTFKLFYLANIRLPTEKAHGLQIMQMCEAFARTKAGADEVEVTLIVPRRDNSPEMAQIRDPWAYYGVRSNFAVWRIVCLDLFRWILPNFGPTAFLTDQIRSFTSILSLLITLMFRRADVYYSRDLLTVLALSLFKPRRSIVYEAHQLAHSRIGGRLQRWGVRRAGLVVAVTARLGADLSAYGARHVHVAHDGIRLERFVDMPDQAAARERFNLPANAFIAGYMGQLHTMSMSKGVDVLIDAIAQSGREITLCLVGGPAPMADVLRERWLSLGLPAERFIFVGRVNPPDVPACLAAFDVCTMPFPWTEHFAYYASPLKLFEYMASGRAIVSSDLPSTAEVVRDGETALLVPPSEAGALAAALIRLHDDPALRERIGTAAQQEVGRYSWQARAEGILKAVSSATVNSAAEGKMRVALLSTAPADTHGWGRYTRDLIVGLAQQPQPPEIVFITARDAAPTTDLPVTAMHRVLPSLTPARRFSLLRLLAAIPAVIRLTAGCDVVHVIAEPYAITVPFARKVVVTAHGTYTARTAAHKLAGALYRRIYHRATMICVSSYTEQQVKSALPAAHTVVIINGVNAAHYEQPGTPPTKTGPTVLSVGQVKHRKGAHVLAKAMKAVCAAVPDARAVFIGDTSDRGYVEKLQAQISADGLQDAITLTGRVSEDVLLGWYHAADVFALPSLNVDGKFEGFGLVYLEASAAGLPVIGTWDCGAEDAIRDGETGYLVAQDDPAALAEAIIRLLNDDALRKKMAAAGRTFASENTWDRVAARVIEQYSAVESGS